jgi:CRISPR/Cas system CSM-associated protein Csm2 small subunit
VLIGGVNMNESEKLMKQNELIISLLGRIAFNEDKLRELILRGSKKKSILNAYNLCDGERKIKEIAKMVNITPEGVGAAVIKWNKLGIVLKYEEGRDVIPMKLYEVSVKEDLKCHKKKN